MIVNGLQASLENTVSLREFLALSGYDPQCVAVEKNGRIVPKKAYDAEMLLDSDRLEIVCFVGGG